MRRKKTLKGRRSVSAIISILLAGGIGYLTGGMPTAALRSTDVPAAGMDLSAAESVALRFPDAWTNLSSAPQAAPPSAVKNANAAKVTGDPQLALLSPEPMIPQAAPQTVAQAAVEANPPVTSDAMAAPGTQTPVQVAALEDAGSMPVADQGEHPQQAVLPPPRAAPAATVPPASQPKAAAAAPAAVLQRHIVNRPGYMLNDAQIASIKARLHLTPDQEQMWPGVEAALRNMAYTQVQEARARGGYSNAQVAAVAPDAVQGLKSAAAPLMMSFNTEQKEEVRNIVHVMGLDQLASQF
jgi:hypothetical protein